MEPEDLRFPERGYPEKYQQRIKTVLNHDITRGIYEYLEEQNERVPNPEVQRVFGLGERRATQLLVCLRRARLVNMRIIEQDGMYVPAYTNRTIYDDDLIRSRNRALANDLRV